MPPAMIDARFLVLTSLVILTLFAAPYATHADHCQVNESHATSADVPIMKQNDISNATEGVCWDKEGTIVGKDAGQAKQYLRSILCPGGGSYGGAGPDGTINGLDAKFSVCAASFLKSANNQGIPSCVNEGYRTPGQQKIYSDKYKAGTGGIACDPDRKSCEHPRGIAIDVNTDSEGNYKRLHVAAPSFGLVFYLGFKDKVHFVPMKGGCNSGGNIGNIPADQNLPAEHFDFPEEYRAATSPPRPPLGQRIRNMLGLDQLNTMECFTSLNPPQIAPPGTVPQSQCLTNSDGFGGQPQLPPLPPPQQQQPPPQQPPPQSTQPGSSQPPVSSLISTNPPVSGSINPRSTQSGNNTTSTFDLIDEYANPVSGLIDIASIVPIALNDSTFSSTTQLQATSTPIGNASGTIAINQTYTPQQTFTSGDLANNPVWGVVPQQNGFLARLLSTLKDILLYALDYLRPFGRNVPTQQYLE